MDKMDMMCPQCGAAMDYDAGEATLRCPHCGMRMLVDDGRVRVDSDSFEDAGYRFEQGRLQAQREAAEAAQRQQMARQAAMEQARRQISRVNMLCLILCFAMPFTLFQPKWLSLAVGAALMVWAVADRRLGMVAKVFAFCFALPVIAWRLILG